MAFRIIDAKESASLSLEAKWHLLSPYLKQHGGRCMSYSTLQPGMEYFIDEDRGYLAYHTIRHPVLAPFGRRIVLGDPVAAVSDYASILRVLSPQRTCYCRASL